MKLLLSFRIPGLPPSVNSMYSRSRFGVFKKIKTKEFEKKFVSIFTKRPHIECPTVILLEFHIKTTLKYSRRDTDNFLKCTLDCLQVSGQIRNDNKVVMISGIKIRDSKNFILGYIYEAPEKEIKTIYDVLNDFEVIHSDIV